MNLCDKNKCTGCAACYSICPKGAISMVENKEGFLYPEIDEEKCVECGLCQKACPVTNSREIEKDIHAYACYSKNLSERLQSSSGGIFSLIAKEILKKDGVVFGAAFDEEFNVSHICVKTETELEKLRGSKYVQSQIGETYKQVKQFLEEDKYVFFTGTPCQVEGLNYFLGKNYETLYTQDLICHGVPSPKVWNEYKKYRQKIDKSKPTNINFRNKENGWKNYRVGFDYENKFYKEDKRNDLYIRAFLRNACLRESCYDCSFKKKYRNSDITLGDFWGIEKLHPEFDDDKGTSLMILNSAKGIKLFENIKEDIEVIEIDLEKAIQYNPVLIKSVKKDKNREEFYKHIDVGEDFKKIIEKYTEHEPIYITFLKKIYRKLRSILNQIKR